MRRSFVFAAVLVLGFVVAPACGQDGAALRRTAAPLDVREATLRWMPEPWGRLELDVFSPDGRLLLRLRRDVRPDKPIEVDLAELLPDVHGLVLVRAGRSLGQAWLP